MRREASLAIPGWRRRWAGRGRGTQGRQIGQDVAEIVVGFGFQAGVQTLAEFLQREPAVGGVLAQLLGHRVPLSL